MAKTILSKECISMKKGLYQMIEQSERQIKQGKAEDAKEVLSSIRKKNGGLSAIFT